MGKRNGFTLVELMVVIVIIGILAAVAIPRMTQATHRARANEGGTVLAGIANMQHVYTVTHSGFVTANAAADWTALGFTTEPNSPTFDFTIGPGGADDGGFLATATLRATAQLGPVATGFLSINANDERIATGSGVPADNGRAAGGIRGILTNWHNVTAATPNPGPGGS